MLIINEHTANKIIAEYEAKRKEYYNTGGYNGPHCFPSGLEGAANVCKDAISVRNKFGGDLQIVLTDEIVKGIA